MDFPILVFPTPGGPRENIC